MTIDHDTKQLAITHLESELNLSNDNLRLVTEEGYIERGKLNAACELFGIAHQTAKHAASGCRAFPKRCRQRHLLFGHHKEVANRDEATDLLTWATDNTASVAALREEKKRRDSGELIELIRCFV